MRQAGALAFPLCELLDGRISELQKAILEEARELPADQLATMEQIAVASS